jgi:hypothetical protein
MFRSSSSLSARDFLPGCQVYARWRSVSTAGKLTALFLTANADALGLGRPVPAEESTESLAAAAQSPVAAMYSLPFQNNTYFGAGPNHDKSA